MDEIREMKELKDVIVSAYYTAFPKDTITESKNEALRKIQIFVEKIPLLESIAAEDKEKLLRKGIDLALVNFHNLS